MALNMDGGLFEAKNQIRELNKFSVLTTQEKITIASSGDAITGDITFPAGELGLFKKILGYAITITLVNEGGASRNSTILLENLTKGTTLLSGNVDIADGEGVYNNSFWSLEYIQEGDEIKLTIGNEGVGSHQTLTTGYWNCTGTNFSAESPDVANVVYSVTNPSVHTTDNGVRYVANVDLPHGAIVTAVAVTGDAGASAETWYLRRCVFNGTGTNIMAQANISSEDTSISNATIDNANYTYWISTTSLDSGDEIWDVRISYSIYAPTSPLGYFKLSLKSIYRGEDETTTY